MSPRCARIVALATEVGELLKSFGYIGPAQVLGVPEGTTAGGNSREADVAMTVEEAGASESSAHARDQPSEPEGE